MSTRQKIKVGVFGARRGMSMIRVLAEHPEAELVAICDQFDHLLKECADLAEKNDLQVTLYKDFENFFNHEMEAVVLANYATEHAPFAVRLLRSGRHVLSEVLPVQTLAEAVLLAEALEESGKVYAYAENYCYFPATMEMKRLYREGAIGEFMHGEGEYVHDCESIWPQITYGDPNHWRNRMYSTFYCTHSIGPLLTITGTRPVRVVGFETPNVENMANLGYRGGTSGMIVMQMDNGATVKSLHGNLKREPSSVWYSVYGKSGMMESDRWHEGKARINLFREGDSLTETEVSYRPKAKIQNKLAAKVVGHGGSDFYPVHYFLEKILGREAGEESIDLYQALDMALPGILAYRSICSGNIPLTVPNFREQKVREEYRDDHWCRDPEVAGDNLAPACSFGEVQVDDSVYEKVRKMWEEIRDR